MREHVMVWWWSVIIFLQSIFSIFVKQTTGNIYSDDGTRFKCPLDPLTDRYADPTDPSCVRYFLCHLGHAFPRRCDVRTAFHPTLKECYPRYQVPEDLCALPIECQYNGYMVDPEDCTKYFICFFHQAIHYACMSHHYFDPQKSLCVKDKKKSDSCSKPKPILNGPHPLQQQGQQKLLLHVRSPPSSPIEKGPSDDDGGGLILKGSEVEGDDDDTVQLMPYQNTRMGSSSGSGGADINLPSVLTTSDF